MKILVNTRLLLKDKLEGIGWFTYETLKRITVAHPEHEFYFVFDRPFANEFVFSSNVTPLITGLPTRHPLLYYHWFEHSLPRLIKRIAPDLFLSPDGYLSLSSTVPSLPVIHDLNFMHRPQDLPAAYRYYYRRYFLRFAQHARRIATVSQYSANDIANTFGISPGKIDVVYNGANELFAPISQSDTEHIREEISNGKPYFLYVGTLHPRKNIEGLLQAYEQFRKRSPLDIKLVIVGGAVFTSAYSKNVYVQMTYGHDVKFLGRQSSTQLRKITGGAFASIFVPFFEGFGIPVLEALYCDVPVIASNTTAMPEVAGEAALYVDPHDTAQIADAMLQITQSAQLRAKIIEAGRLQRQKFSWDNTANALWKCIENCV